MKLTLMLAKNDDDANIEYDDGEIAENMPPVAETPNRERESTSPCPTTNNSRSTFSKT